MKTIVGIFFCTIFLSGCGALFNLSLSEKQREENMRERIYVTNPENRPKEIAISLKNFTVSSLEKDFIVNVMDQGGNLIIDSRFDLSDTYFLWIDPEKRIDTTFKHQSVWNFQLPEPADYYGDTLYVHIWRLVKEPLSLTGGTKKTNVAKVILATK
jgi:hypothetical protein